MTFDLCYKCFLSREKTHPSAHTFIPIGPEYAAESEASESETEDDDDDDDDEEEEEDEDEEEEEGEEGGGGVTNS